MPGIVGFITRNPRSWGEPRLIKMLEAVSHEAFYSNGTFVDDSLGVYVGWTSRKDSFSAGMPLRSETGDSVLVFSGDEYPQPNIRAELKAKGHSLSSAECDYLVHQYEDDSEFFERLNGMFHGLAIDRRGESATLFNDRYGMHRVFYHQSGEVFYFATEAKAILAVRKDLREPDLQGVGEFLACSCTLQNRTVFRGIQSLPGGSAWTFRKDGTVQKKQYFQPSQWEKQATLEPEAYYAQLREAFSTNLPRYFEGSEKTGIALTGGLDTRVIMAWQKAKNPLPCYTFGGMFRESQDVAIARRVAKVCNQPYQVITVGNEFLKNFSYYAERSVYLSEAGADVYRASDLYVSEQARGIATAKIVGTYGSEILRHAVMFKPMLSLSGLLTSDIFSSAQEAAKTYADLRRSNPVTFAAFFQSPWYHHGILALEQSQLSVRSPYMDNEFVRIAYCAPPEHSGADERLRLVSDGNPKLARFRTDRGLGGSSGKMATALWRGFLEFTFKAEYAYDYGMPPWLVRLDHSISALHPERLFLGRHKLLHFRVWYRNELAKYVREMLLDSRTLSRPFINRVKLEKAVTEHLSGKANHTTAIHKLLTLELLCRLFFDPS